MQFNLTRDQALSLYNAAQLVLDYLAMGDKMREEIDDAAKELGKALGIEQVKTDEAQSKIILL